MSDGHRAAFRAESRELLADLESALVEMETNPDNGELAGRIFRALHTLKGTAGSFGLLTLAGFVHQFESLLELVRSGEIEVDRELVTAGLGAVDLLRSLVHAPEGSVSVPEELPAAFAALTARRRAAPRRQAAAVNPAALDVSYYAALLTEYELSRVQALAGQGKFFYLLTVFLALEALNEELSVYSAKIAASGEIIATTPLNSPAPEGALGFDILFASSCCGELLAAELGATPRAVDYRTLLEQEKPLPAPAFAGDTTATYRIRFTPRPDSLKAGLNPLALITELKGLGDCLVIAQAKSIPPLAELDPEGCYVFWDIVLSTGRAPADIRTVFAAAREGSEVRIDTIDDGTAAGNDRYKKLGEILVERGDISPAELAVYLDSQKQLGQILAAAGAVPPRAIESALLEQNYMQGLLQERLSREAARTVRVATDKLDRLVTLAGDMAALTERISRCVGRHADPELAALAAEGARLTAALDDTARRIRMEPVGATFSRFRRVVRDLGVELGKRVRLTTGGDELELERSIAEKLYEPLLHLLRNSLDHGLETPEVRIARGKPPEGTVQLAAERRPAALLITVADDGRGLDYGAIETRAVACGLLPAGSGPSLQQLTDCLFVPGFSTAAAVSTVSGRGVGMDVVRRALQTLGGSISLHSVAGEGTTVSISIPLPPPLTGSPAGPPII